MILKRILIVLMISFLCWKCTCCKNFLVGSSLNDIQFLIFPHVIERDGKYFLQYQIDVDTTKINLLRVVYSKVMDRKAYYFFSSPLSHPEWGKLIERSLDEDGFTDYAKHGNVYWLNQDKSVIKLEIEKND
jgi:hypothetical protein